jgi:hypothetical protein
MNKRFLFFENFRSIADKLPDDMRLKFYDALLAYVFDGVEPDDVMIAALITAIKPSLDKEDKRGGNHNPIGQNQYSEVKTGQKEVKNNFEQVKNGQSGQSFLETETGNGNRKQKTENIITQSSDKSSDCVARKKLVPIDWFPKLETVDKLSAKGLDTEKVVERFINSCRAKNLKYVDFDRAILAWDWSKDTSVQKEKCWF